LEQRYLRIMFAVFGCFPLVVLAQIQLITLDEALRPDGQFAQTRAITRGPSIQFLSPREVEAAGFLFKVAIEAKGGATIDNKSLKVEYLKEPLIDVTQRFSSHFRENRLEIPQAKVPPGRHLLRLTVKDSEGRQGSQIIQIQAH
jgi:hypothetical protein